MFLRHKFWFILRKSARTGVIAVFLSSDTIHNSAVMKMDVAEIRSIYETIVWYYSICQIFQLFGDIWI